MPKPARVYWDACTWIAYINSEKVVPLRSGGTENRFSMCSSVFELAKKSKIEIVTSAFTLAEVCKSADILSSPLDNLASFFERSYILLIPVDLQIGRLAQNYQTSGLGGLKPPDAVHLASARRASVQEFHTFDDKILSLDGKINGLNEQPIKICRPTMGSSLGPLFGPNKDVFPDPQF